MDEADKLIERAGQLLIEKGLAKGKYGNDRVGYCALGALYAASEQRTTKDRFMVRKASARVAEQLPGYYRSMAAWDSSSSLTHYNDQPETTLEDILDLFRRAMRSQE